MELIDKNLWFVTPNRQLINWLEFASNNRWWLIKLTIELLFFNECHSCEQGQTVNGEKYTSVWICSCSRGRILLQRWKRVLDCNQYTSPKAGKSLCVWRPALEDRQWSAWILLTAIRHRKTRKNNQGIIGQWVTAQERQGPCTRSVSQDKRA